MVLLDAAPLIALVAAEPARPAVRGLIEGGDAAIPAPNLAEALDLLSRRQGVPEASLRAVLDPLLSTPVTVLATGAEHAWKAGLLRARHHHRSRQPVSVADCLLLACAGKDDAVVSSDGALLAIAREEGIAVHPVRNSRGEMPQ